MQSKRWKVRLACGLPLLLLAGCFPHNPYGPYGPGAYPGVYSTPPAGLAVPNGVIVQPPSTQTLPGNSAPLWQQSQDPVPPNLNPPILNPSTNGAGDSNGTLPVPDPIAPGSFGDGTDNLDFNDSDTPAPFNSKQGSLRNTGHDVPQEQMASRSTAEDAGAFVDPVPVDPAALKQTSAESDEAAARRPNPFDHDREDFRWLRGVVDYDEADKTWNIIYDMNPDRTDRFGGSITLGDDERLSELHDDDVVLVEGRVDANARDRSGKPLYHVERLARLVPKKQIAQSDP